MQFKPIKQKVCYNLFHAKFPSPDDRFCMKQIVEKRYVLFVYIYMSQYIYIYVIQNINLFSTIKTTGFNIQGYADDQQIYRYFKACDQVITLNNRIDNRFKTVQEWMYEYHLQLNPGKTKIMLFAPSAILKEITIHGVQLTKTICTRFVSTT